MARQRLFFVIDDETWFEIDIPVKIENLFRWDDTNIILQHKKERYTVCFREMALYALWFFKDYLQNALQGKRVLHESIAQTTQQSDIGYLYNIDLVREDYKSRHPLLFENFDENGTFSWIGYSYLMWGSRKCIQSWLYEDKGKFFIKLTPSYRWPFRDPKKNKNYYPPETFLKNYKPYLTIIVSRKVLQRLRQQAEDLMNIILTNDDKYTIPSKRARPVDI